jgi:hypothetical protein
MNYWKNVRKIPFIKSDQKRNNNIVKVKEELEWDKTDNLVPGKKHLTMGSI